MDLLGAITKKMTCLVPRARRIVRHQLGNPHTDMQLLVSAGDCVPPPFESLKERWCPHSALGVAAGEGCGEVCRVAEPLADTVPPREVCV